MAVAFDARGTSQQSGTASPSITYNGLTVGAGATSLLAFVVTLGNAGATSMSWDNTGTNQAMTLLVSETTGSACCMYLFGLLNPTPGNKNLLVSLGTSNAYLINACSFTGTANSGSISNTFMNTSTTDTSTNTTSGSQIGSISFPSTDIGIAICTAGLSNTFSARSDTLWFSQANVSDFTTDAQYIIGPSGPTHTYTWTYGTSTKNDTMCVEVVAGVASFGERNLITPRLVLPGMPRGLAGRAQMFPFSLPVTAAPPVVKGSTLPMMGVG